MGEYDRDFCIRSTPQLAGETLALILAGGSGNRLKALTQWHAKPALPVAGNYRNIDFPLSNCVNSGLRRIAVLTQYKSHSLIQHLSRGWNLLRPELGEFVELWPAQQRSQQEWYTGTANAVFQNLDIIEEYAPSLVLVLAGDHIYKMNYLSMLREHVQHAADLTIGCVHVDAAEAGHFGVVSRSSDKVVTGFVEKPSDGRPHADAQGRVLASMGIYVFSSGFLAKVLRLDEANPASAHDFGHNVIPAAMRSGRVYAYVLGEAADDCGDYWRDVGTLDAYWQAHMELLGATPALELGDPHWPIHTYREPLPPARFVRRGAEAPGVALQSMVADGCAIDGGTVLGSVLFPRVHVGCASQVSEAVVLPGAHIGQRCRVRRAIVESGCEIPDGWVIGEDRSVDERRFVISEGGIVLVTRESLRAAEPARAARRGGSSARVA